MLTVLGAEAIVAGNYAATLTIPSGTKAIVAMVSTGHSAASSYVRIGGLDLTYRGRVVSNVYGVEAWVLESLVGISGSALSWSGDGPYNGQWRASIVYIGGSAPAFHEWALAGIPGSCLAHSAPPLGNLAAVAHAHSYGGTRLQCSGQTPIFDNTGNVGSGYIVGADGAGLAVGITGMSIAGVVGTVSLYDSAPVLEPGRLGESVAFRAGIDVTAPTDGTVYLTRLGEVVAWRPGLRIAATAKRQVALVGEGIETSEMTEGGTEGQVLTQHARRKPTWEDAAGGASALDDLTDVNAPSPADTNLLGWDAATSKWVPKAAGAPDLSAAVLDDIGDVDALAPDDGDVLTWDDYQAAWVPAAPAGAFPEAAIPVVFVAPEADDHIDQRVPFDCRITRGSLLADQAGDIVVDVWVDTYANFPPTDADSITASAPLTLSSAASSEDSTLTGWTRDLVKGDVIRWHVDTAATVEQVTAVLEVERT